MVSLTLHPILLTTSPLSVRVHDLMQTLLATLLQVSYVAARMEHDANPRATTTRSGSASRTRTAAAAAARGGSAGHMQNAGDLDESQQHQLQASAGAGAGKKRVRTGLLRAVERNTSQPTGADGGAGVGGRGSAARGGATAGTDLLDSLLG